MNPEYSNMTVKELRKLVREKGWTGSTVLGALKAELIKFLETGERPGQSDVSGHAVSSDELTFEFSTFPNKTNSNASSVTLSGDGFLRLLTNRSLRKQKDGKLFAPATFNGSRKNDNFISASGICLDFDRGRPDVTEVVSLFPNTMLAYYSTHSHTLENPHFRVVILLSRPVGEEDHARLVSGVKRNIPANIMECLDSTCFERSRPHYLPSCPPESDCHAFTGSQNGKPLDVDHFISSDNVVEIEGYKVIAPIQSTQNVYEFTDPATGEVVDLVKWAAQNPDFDLVSAIDQHYRRGALRDGKQHIQCPFEEQHTDQGKDLATFVANSSQPDNQSFTIHCCHAHCVERDRLDFLKMMLERGWVLADILHGSAQKPLVLSHPKYSNYQSTEIAFKLQHEPLAPEEFRFHLHMMHLALLNSDGTLEDDIWKLSRALGITEDRCSVLRSDLIRAGWCVSEGGRLFDPITRREFLKAQSALIKKSGGGHKGGVATQAKYRNKHTSNIPSSIP